MKYTELPKDENPRNRIHDLGPMSLSASEVLAVALWFTDIVTCHLFKTKPWVISCHNKSSCRR
jgi:DNA repair protein RadC